MSYYIDVNDWNHEIFERRIQVAQSFYDETRTGDVLRVEQMPGYFAWRWLQGYERVARAPPTPTAAAPAGLSIWHE